MIRSYCSLVLFLMPFILICNILKSLGLGVVSRGVGLFSVEEQEWDGEEGE